MEMPRIRDHIPFVVKLQSYKSVIVILVAAQTQHPNRSVEAL